MLHIRTTGLFDIPVIFHHNFNIIMHAIFGKIPQMHIIQLLSPVVVTV